MEKAAGDFEPLTLTPALSRERARELTSAPLKMSEFSDGLNFLNGLNDLNA